MNYQEIYEAIAQNHSDHWGGTNEEMFESDRYIAKLEQDYPELYAQAQTAFNEYLRSL